MSEPGTSAFDSRYRIASVGTLCLLALTTGTAASQSPINQMRQSDDTVDGVIKSDVEGPRTSDEDQQRASLLFERGRTAFARGDYAAAARAFDQAYAVSPHHSSLWNAALSWERGAEPVKAANRFADYLDKAPPNAPDRETATERLQVLSARLGRFELQAEGLTDLQVDGHVVASATVYVSPGSHVVTARNESLTVRRIASVQAGELLSIVLSSASGVVDTAKAVDAKANADEPEPKLTPAHVHPSVVPDTDTSWHGLPPFMFYTGTAITAALIGVTIWSGVDTLDAKENFDREQSRANLEAGRDKQDRTNILFAVTLGVALLTGATALWLVDWDGVGSDRETASTLISARW